MERHPPRLAQRIFRWYCRNHLYESILGDLDEQFYQNYDVKGSLKASWIYWMNVLRLINRFTLRRTHPSSSNYYSKSMIKNNLISSFRFLKKHKTFALINTLGMTIGFTSFILILIFVRHEISFEQFHDNRDQVFRVNFSFQDNSGSITTLVNSPPALATEIQGKFPELNKISRMRYSMSCLLSNNQTSFYEDHGYYADSTFLEILKFKFSSGNPKTALDQPNSIVITEDLALKYFNDLSPIGETLLLNNSVPLRITGILTDVPTNSHLNFNFLISFSTYTVPEGYASDLTSMSWLGFLTYVELKPNSNPDQFQDKLTQYFKDLDPGNPTPFIPSVQNISEIYLGSNEMADDLASHIRSNSHFNVNALVIVSILILVVAGFNFSNLSNALAINRSKNTGVRKVLGASKKSILFQLLSESLILTMFCLTLSFVFVGAFFSSVAQYMEWEFALTFQVLQWLTPIMIFIGMLIGTFSSLFSSLKLASLDVIKSLKGTLKVGTRNPLQLKNILVLLQLSISLGLIASVIIITQQINFLTDKPTGYDSENVVLIKLLPEEMSEYYETFKELLMQNTSVTSVSRSERTVGEQWPWSIALPVNEDPENSKRVFFNQADYDFFQTMGIQFQSGRSFQEAYSSDPTRSIILNQLAVDYLGMENPVGKQVHFMEIDGPRTIVGVVENFNYSTLHQEIGPAVMILPFIDLEHMYVRFAPGNLRKQIEGLEDTWDQLSSESPLAWNFLDEKLDQAYKSEQKLSTVLRIFSVLTILLACLGLYGIVAFMLKNRIKEVGIRKVLGASAQTLYTMFIGKYIIQVLIALGIVFPVVHHLLGKWLEDFAYHIQINWLIYPISACMLLVLILGTITYQILNATQVNPTHLLRDE